MLLTLDTSNGGSDDGVDDIIHLLDRKDSLHVPDNAPGSEQYKWLEPRLATARDRGAITFVAFHHSPFTSGRRGCPPGGPGRQRRRTTGRGPAMMSSARAVALLAGASVAAAGWLRAAETVPPETVLAANRVLVLGDSITYDGDWVAQLIAWMERRGTAADVIDAGLPGETVSGLSEAGHAEGRFPRPDLSDRLGSLLRIVRPDVVVACYGMNCGIYQPLDDGRFARFRAGIDRLHATVAETGATIIHLTPPVYDQRPTRRDRPATPTTTPSSTPTRPGSCRGGPTAGSSSTCMAR